MPVLLTACALRDVMFICSRWFNVYDFYGRNFINFFVGSRSTKNRFSGSLDILW
jgi:hypothetical protein